MNRRAFSLLSLVAVAASSPVASAQDAPAQAGGHQNAGSSRPWGLETELVQPFIPEVHIATLKATRRLWGREGGLAGDAVVGVYLRPNVKHNVVDEIDEYTGIAGYRQYLWRGLHVEGLTYLGWARGTRNKINGKNYEDFAWLAEISGGYRFSLAEAGPLALYVTPQAGYLVGVYTNIGPRETPDRFVTGKLLVGAQF